MVHDKFDRETRSFYNQDGREVKVSVPVKTNYSPRTLAYIPTGHRLAINSLGTHEYFGNDFMKGTANVAIFLTTDGKQMLRAVWSYGDWKSYGFEEGDEVYFEHTQSMRKTRLTFVSLIPSTRLFGPKLVPQWTLK